MAAFDLISVYDPTFWAQETLVQLFPMLKFAGLVYRNFEGTVASQGDTVNTRMPNKFSATDVNPDSFSSVKPTADNVQVKLDTWKEVVFEIGDKEQSLSVKDLQSEFAFPAAQAIAQVIEQKIIGLYQDVFQTSGIAGQTPSTVAAIGTDVKQAMDTALIPEQDRCVVLGPAGVNRFNQIFFQDYVSGSTDQQLTGMLRPKFGMAYTDSNLMPTQIIGTAWSTNSTIANGVGSGGVLTNGAQTVVAANGGSALRLGQLPLSGNIALKGLANSSPINQGDVFTIAGQNYTVTVATNSDSSGHATVTASPVLQADVADGVAVTNLQSHAVNLAFHRQAFSLVSRPLLVPTAPGANVSVVNFNGLGLRCTVWYSPKDVRTFVRLDVLFGVKTLDARKAIRVLG